MTPTTPLKTNSAATKTSFRRMAGAATTALAIIALPLTASAAAINITKVSGQFYGEEVSVNVPTDMLKTEAGVAKLYAALDRRAEKSCRTTIPMQKGKPVSVKRCKAALLDDFVTEISHAGLSSLHEKDG